MGVLLIDHTSIGLNLPNLLKISQTLETEKNWFGRDIVDVASYNNNVTFLGRNDYITTT